MATGKKWRKAKTSPERMPGLSRRWYDMDWNDVVMNIVQMSYCSFIAKLIFVSWSINRVVKPCKLLKLSSAGIFTAIFLFEWNSFNLGKLPKKKNVFFGRSLPNVGGWGGWFPNKVQTPQNPRKPPRKSPFLTFRFPKSHKNPGVGGWENRFGKDIKKKRFFWQLP